MKPLKMSIQICQVIMSSLLITGCQQGMITADIVTSSTPFSSTTIPITSVPSVIATPERLTPTPGIRYQVTYLAACQQATQCMYAIDVGCLETDFPCMGEPQLLFEVPRIGPVPTPPIISYSWSPDGQQIAVEATGLGGKDDIYVGNGAGQSWSNITQSPDNEGGPIWSPCGMYIAYTAKSGWPDYSIRILRNNPNGQGSIELLPALTSLDFIGIHQLSWSSDGEHLAFVHSDVNGYSQVFIANLDGSGLRQITSLSEDHFQPDYSPNGHWVVAIRRTDRFSPDDEIILIETNSTDVIQVILRPDGHMFTPTWSPVGNWIVFLADLEGNKDIYLVRSDGTGLMNLTQSSNDEHAPAWRVVLP